MYQALSNSPPVQLVGPQQAEAEQQPGLLQAAPPARARHQPRARPGAGQGEQNICRLMRAVGGRAGSSH